MNTLGNTKNNGNVFGGQYIVIKSIRKVHTLDYIPEKLLLVPGNEDWAQILNQDTITLVAEPITLVEFIFATADQKIRTPLVGRAKTEFATWVRDSVASGLLDSTHGIAFSGVMIAHLAFALGEATHVFPWAGVFEPRTGGGWIGHVHGAKHQPNEPFFLDLASGE